MIQKLIEDEKYEPLRFLLSGANTTFVNYLVFFTCRGFGVELIVANTLAFLVAVCVAFVVNKKFVYRQNDYRFKVVIREFGSFIGLRLFSNLVDSSLLYLFVKVLFLSEVLAKIINSGIVTVMNYIFGKFVTFRKEKTDA